MVLHTSCILQFDHIKYICIERITEKLNYENCLKVWLSTEQLDIVPLYLKAKNLALTEFNLIQHMDFVMELDLNQLKRYLASIHLKSRNEIDVFLTAIKWFYEQETRNKVRNKYDTLLEILSCLSFVSLSDGHIHEILSYPDISNQRDLVDILNCLLKLRNLQDVSTYKDKIVAKAMQFNETKRRYQPKLLCLFLNNQGENAGGKQIKSCITVCKVDNYKRKRMYNIVGSANKLSNDQEKNSNDSITKCTKSIMYYGLYSVY